MKRLLLIIVFASLFQGCYSYYEISRENYPETGKNQKIKLVAKDKEELIIDSYKRIIENESLKIINGDITISISLSKVDKISERRTDWGKTAFAVGWFAFVGTVVFFLAVPPI